MLKIIHPVGEFVFRNSPPLGIRFLKQIPALGNTFKKKSFLEKLFSK